VYGQAKAWGVWVLAGHFSDGEYFLGFLEALGLTVVTAVLLTAVLILRLR
jgi:hypothetical protein